MDCLLLGSGGMMPMPYRWLTSLGVRLGGHVYLFDAGEGCQINLKQARLGIKSLRVIAVSHLHGDHCLGVPGLLMFRAQVPDPGPLTILGPPGVERFVLQLQEVMNFFVGYPVRFVEWMEGGPEVAYEDETVRILWEPLKHTVTCLGYRLEEHPRPGLFNSDAASALGVQPGPLRGMLQRGEEVTLVNGVRILPRQVLGPSRPGRHVCYAVDTRPTKSLYRLCRNVDIAFLEGMLSPEHRADAEEKGHMTVDEAARVASASQVQRAVLVHISPRYKEEDLEGLSAAASQRFEKIEMGRDLRWYSVPFRDQVPSKTN